jgi:hypothetical protein
LILQYLFLIKKHSQFHSRRGAGSSDVSQIDKRFEKRLVGTGLFAACLIPEILGSSAWREARHDAKDIIHELETDHVNFSSDGIAIQIRTLTISE